MNKKTFVVAVVFLCATLGWFVSLLWLNGSVFDIVISLLFILASAGMVYSEYGKKKRVHISDVKRNKIP